VTYNTTGLLEKNRDTLSGDIASLLSYSQEPLVRALFAASKITARGSLVMGKTARMQIAAGAAQPKRTPLTVTRTFALSLTDLLNKINRTVPRFVRCMKPNVYVAVFFG
jgi:myosin heavy subunit